VLLRVYENADVIRAIAENPEHADIPELHKLVYRWTEKFVTKPWQLGADDIAQLRGAGISDREITQWVVRASSQSWFTMCADGAGVELDGGLAVGPAVGRERIAYERECKPAMFTREIPLVPGSSERRSSISWVETVESGETFARVEQDSQNRWGTMPVLLRAISSLPESLEIHTYMLQLLEKPQSEALPPRTHALVRAEVATTNRTSWANATIDTLLARHTGPLDEIDLMATSLAKKLVLTPWKVTGKDAEAFRGQGFEDEVYLDVLNTTAIQNALDRLSWALGVPDDAVPLLTQELD
jgi:alkylhydroperoxidase family enzyme